MLMLRWRHVETCVCVFCYLVLKGRLWHFPAKSYLFRMAYIIFMAGQPTSPNVPTPAKNGYIDKALGKPMVNKPLIRPFFFGGVMIGGVRLTSHKISNLTGGPSPGVQETHLSFWSGKWGHLWRGMRSSWEGIGCFQWPKRKGSSLQCLQVTSLTSKEL